MSATHDENAPSTPPRLIYDSQYEYVGQWRFPAHCWLRVYVPDAAHDLPVVIATELPDNEGTSVTNFAERLAWNVLRDPHVWAKAPEAAREGVFWIEHYPEERDVTTGQSSDETFSVVTFAYNRDAEADAGKLGTISFVSEDPDNPEDITIEQTVHIPAAAEQGTLGEPSWQYITREQVEQMLGQPFAPIPSR